MSSDESKISHQLQLGIERELQKDRNFSKGGRSFYFFDFDDNIAYLKTEIYLFHTDNKEQSISLTSGEFAKFHHLVGKHGQFKQYEINFDDPVGGSFRNFRDQDLNAVEKVFGKKQKFVQDILEALKEPDYLWKGPSWNCFYHAVFNQRPLSLITARGHEVDTINHGISQLVESRHLPRSPNYLSVFAVNHPETKEFLSSGQKLDVAELKKKAIHASVEKAFEVYGENQYHRFGMSDDDPKNIELILQAMTELKQRFTENSFFVFDSSRGQLLKREVFTQHIVDEEVSNEEQLTLLSKKT